MLESAAAVQGDARPLPPGSRTVVASAARTALAFAEAQVGCWLHCVHDPFPLILIEA